MADTRPGITSGQDCAFRETFLSGFERREDAELWRRTGELLFRMALESEDWGWPPGQSLIGFHFKRAADELEVLVSDLKEISDALTHFTVDATELSACRKATDLSEVLDKAVKSLREAASLRLAAEEAPG